MQQQRQGRYLVSRDAETFRIFPKDRYGRTRPVWISRNFIYLKHDCGTEVSFKRYLHMKKWYWRDSRDTTHCSEQHVVTELARMLYAGDREPAIDLMILAITGK